MVLRLVGAGFDDRRGGALGLSFIFFQPICELLVKGQVVPFEVDQSQELARRGCGVLCRIVRGNQRLVNLLVVWLESHRELKLSDCLGVIVAGLIGLSDGLAENWAVLAGLGSLFV